MRSSLCLLIGYLLGSLSPAAWLSRKKEVDLRQEGTKNLGASNALLIFGKKAGVFVMLLDIAKAYLSSRLAKLLFPQLVTAGLLAGLGAVLGHIYPIHMHFQGGKGFAAYAGMVLAHDPMIFLFLLVLCCALALIVNYGVVMPMAAGALFPLLVWLTTRNIPMLLIASAAGGLIIIKHWSNIARARQGGDVQIRQYLKDHF